MSTPGLVYKVKDIIIRVPTTYSKRIRNVVAGCRAGMTFSVGVDILIQKQSFPLQIYGGWNGK